MPSGLRVTVDARPLDLEHLRAGGIGRYAHGLLGPLSDVASERGCELVLLRHGPPGPGAFAGFSAQGAETRRVHRPPLPERLAELPEQLLLPLDLRRAGAQLHHSLSPYRSALWPGVPFVMTIHDVIPLMWPDEYLRSGTIHRMLYRAARRAQVLLAVSEATRRDTITHLGADPARVRVVPEAAGERFAPADTGPVRARLALDGPYVLWIGGLDPPDARKDVPRLVTEFTRWRTREARREALVLAGRTGEAAREVERRSGGAVRCVGFVPDEDLPGLLSGAACLVSASRYEGFGLPALEAISCGTPVVTFDGGAVPEVAGPGGVTVATGDHAALMNAIGEVCDDAGLRARLSAAGLRHAAGYSWRRSAELTWDAYEQALSPSPQGVGSRP